MYVMFGLAPGAFPGFPSDVEFCQVRRASPHWTGRRCRGLLSFTRNAAATAPLHAPPYPTPPSCLPISPSPISQALLAEENVLCLPGAAFNMAQFVRVVFCAPKPILATAFDRIEAFAARHIAPGYAVAAAGGGAAAAGAAALHAASSSSSAANGI
jgi:hypothetical protein